MEAILKDLEQLAGVQHGCIYHHGEIQASTFPQVLNSNLASMGRMLDQIFNGVESIGKTHNEIYFELDENYLVGYRIDRNFIITLLTGKGINFSLVHISVRSAAAQLKMEDAKPHKAAARAAPVAAAAAPPPAAAPRITEIEEGLKPMLREILTALTHRLGPAAKIVFQERLDEWKYSYEPKAANLGYLIQLLSSEIADKEEKLGFIKDAETLTA
ncbi:MAG: hypothetical protein A2286_00195 [Gammaproteobacteria bacterium RIFOXYA12_FULL_61_12]|nr:MAG: hypothetical protein A2286_00195 [Gammaproteobacteria bacterium RIFOXYA12_FULL_61_12]OGT91463.1 MAG: hypothetical protein A2514_12150 [Gammaproteobacteria bacterium RIFOXYD12_FULL_61_37]